MTTTDDWEVLDAWSYWPSVMDQLQGPHRWVIWLSGAVLVEIVVLVVLAVLGG